MNTNHKIQVIVLITTILVLTSSVLIFILITDNGFKTYKDNGIRLIYEKNWQVTSNDKEGVVLTHRSGATYSVKIIDLNDEYRRTELSLLIEDILKQVEKDNPKYNLVNEEETKISKNKYQAYRYLYETDDLQSMIAICKKNDKVYIINYIADHVKFDILLDSVKDITWNFEILV